jgi:hypothetical protein
LAEKVEAVPEMSQVVFMVGIVGRWHRCSGIMSAAAMMAAYHARERLIERLAEHVEAVNLVEDGHAAILGC